LSLCAGWTVSIVVAISNTIPAVATDFLGASLHRHENVTLNPLKGRDVNWLHLAIQI